MTYDIGCIWICFAFGVRSWVGEVRYQEAVMLKNAKLLQGFLHVASKKTVSNDILTAQFAKGAIEGAVTMLMAQGASYQAAWNIVKEHLPEYISPHAVPQGWKF